MIIFIILGIIAVIYVLYLFFCREKMPNDYCVGFFGTMGSGKTFVSTKKVRASLKKYLKAQKWVRRLRWLLPIPFAICWKRYWCTEVFPWAYSEPLVLSTIPMDFKIHYKVIGKAKRVKSQPLTVSHLLCKTKIPQNTIIYIGEFGKAIASQFDYENAYVQVYLTNWISFCRHWFLGKFGCIIIDEQAPSCIIKEVRVRLGTSYNLSNCWVGRLLPFYRITCEKVSFLNGDTHSDEERRTTDDAETARKFDRKRRFFFGFNNPFRRDYDTRCYSVIYNDGFTIDPPSEFTDLKTRYLPIMPNNDEYNKIFKKDRTKAREAFGQSLRGEE